MSCKRTQGFLAQNEIDVAETVDAKKATIPGKDAFKVLEGITDLWATRGRKVVHVDLAREKPSREELAALLIGPSGNLRAPTLRKGKTLIVGFDEEMYRKVLLGREKR